MMEVYSQAYLIKMQILHEKFCKFDWKMFFSQSVSGFLLIASLF